MFFIFDLGELCDGAAAGVGIGIVLIILFIAIGLPIAFLSEAGGIGLSALFLAFTISALICNIAVAILALKKLKSSNKKIKRNATIVLIMMVTLAIIGFLVPLYEPLLNIKINNAISRMILLPFLCNIIYIALLSIRQDGEKHNGQYYLEWLKVYFLDMICALFLKFVVIVYFILTVLWSLVLKYEELPKEEILRPKTEAFFNYVSSQFEYIDTKYEEVRGNNFSVTEAVENKISSLKSEIQNNKDMQNKIEESSRLNTIWRKFWDDYKDTNCSIYLYLDVDRNTLEKYGLAVTEYGVINKDVIVIRVTDNMYIKTNYYKIDLNKCKIIEEITEKQVKEILKNE